MAKVITMATPSQKTKKDKITNVLFFGDFNCTTGFGNVSKQLETKGYDTNISNNFKINNL
jgi:hypothetical protein